MPEKLQTTKLATLGGLAGLAAVAFVVTARRVFARQTTDADRDVREVMHQDADSTAGEIADVAWPTSKTEVQLPIALLVATGVWTARRRGPAATIAGAAASAALVSRAFEEWLPSRRPPPERDQTEPSFPSGRALETSSIWFTTAYVLAREGLGPPALMVPVALAYPVAASVSKLARDGHWGTDVLGGWLAGAAIAATCAASYEASSGRRAGRRR